MNRQVLTLIFCLILNAVTLTAQSSKKPASKPAPKPATTVTPAKKPANATPPNIAPPKPTAPPQQTEPVSPTRDTEGPLTKYEMYGLIKKYMETNGYNRNWALTERLSNFYLIYKDPVAIVPQKPEATYETEAKENEALLKLYMPKPYEIAIEFLPYTAEQNPAKINETKEYNDKINELKEQYRIADIFENSENKEFFAMDNDERNRLTNYLIAKSFLDSSLGLAPQATDDLLIQGFSVKLQYPRNYYKTIPKQASDDTGKIVQFIETTIRKANNQ